MSRGGWRRGGRWGGRRRGRRRGRRWCSRCFRLSLHNRFRFEGNRRRGWRRSSPVIIVRFLLVRVGRSSARYGIPNQRRNSWGNRSSRRGRNWGTDSGGSRRRTGGCCRRVNRCCRQRRDSPAASRSRGYRFDVGRYGTEFSSIVSKPKRKNLPTAFPFSSSSLCLFASACLSAQDNLFPLG